jgi:hypothetical protein
VTAVANTLLSVSSRTQSLAVQRHGQVDAPSAGLTSATNASGARNAVVSCRVGLPRLSEAPTAAPGASNDCTPYASRPRRSGLRTGCPIARSTARTGVSLEGRPVSRMSMSWAAASAIAPLAEALTRAGVRGVRAGRSRVRVRRSVLLGSATFAARSTVITVTPGAGLCTRKGLPRRLHQGRWRGGRSMSGSRSERR